MDAAGPVAPERPRVARIGKPHGLGGEVTVQLHTDDPERAVRRRRDVRRPRRPPGSGVPRTLTIRSTRVHNGTWLLAFEEIPDRTGAESLRNTRLLLDADERGLQTPETPTRTTAGTRPISSVSRSSRRDGTRVGDRQRARDRRRPGPARRRRSTAGGTAYLPFVEAIVPEVDVAGGRVVVDPPDGLLELNA